MATNFEQIAKTQQTLDQTFKTLKENFVEAEKAFETRRAKILAAIEAEQQQEALHLSQIGKALEEIMQKQQV